jgi:energy-converting hydrogenase Eha subunit H
MNAPEFMLVCLSILVPALLLFYILRRWFGLRERRLEIEAHNAAEKAAQYVARSKEVEARLAVVEQIVTDGGIQTASQIEALRAPRLSKGDKVQ